MAIMDEIQRDLRQEWSEMHGNRLFFAIYRPRAGIFAILGGTTPAWGRSHPRAILGGDLPAPEGKSPPDFNGGY